MPGAVGLLFFEAQLISKLLATSRTIFVFHLGNYQGVVMPYKLSFPKTFENVGEKDLLVYFSQIQFFDEHRNFGIVRGDTVAYESDFNSYFPIVIHSFPLNEKKPPDTSPPGTRSGGART